MITRRTMINLSTLAAVAAVPGVQGKVTHHPVELSTLMNQKQIENDIRNWDAIQLHRTATSGDHQTAQWLAAEISQTGATAEIDSFAFRQRIPGTSLVTDGTHTTVGLPMFDGGSTGPDGVLGAAGVLEQHSPIAVTSYGASPGDKNTRTLEHARRRNTHKAIVAVADVAPNIPGLAVLNAESYSAPFGPPVLQVPTEAGTWLSAAAAQSRELTVHAELVYADTTASNVQTQIAGTQPDLAPLVVMTPRSGWWTCTSERAGGISLWLNAIRYFMANPPRRTVVFTANTGHELGHVGLDHYLEAHPGIITNAHAWIHLGANFSARNGSVVWQASQQRYLDQGLAQLQAQGLEDVIAIPVDTRPFGEARNIYDGGGQFVSLLGSNPLFHHPDDRWPDAIDMAKTVKLNHMMMQMAAELAR